MIKHILACKVSGGTYVFVDGVSTLYRPKLKPEERHDTLKAAVALIHFFKKYLKAGEMNTEEIVLFLWKKKHKMPAINPLRTYVGVAQNTKWLKEHQP